MHQEELVRRDAAIAAQVVKAFAQTSGQMTQPARPPDAKKHLVKEAKEAICESVGCAATASNWAISTDLELALRAGHYAAEHGTCVPLTPLLDLAVATRNSRSPRYLARRAGDYSAAWSEYDFWLDQLYFWLDPKLRSAAASDVPYWSDLVAFNWPAGNSSPVCWAEAYDELRNDQATLQRVLKRWGEPRSSAPDLWKRFWPPRKKEGSEIELPYNVWAKFRELGSSSASYCREGLHEYFDHHAAYFYLHADDPPLRPDQLRRLHRLKFRHSVFGPVLGTPDDQDPHSGQIPLAALVREPFEAAYSAVVNHEVSFLNNPPTKKPPREVHLHLCYAPRYASVATTHSHIKQSARRQAADRRIDPAANGDASQRQATHASTVKGLAALLLEDWRYALNGLPIRFHVDIHDGAEPRAANQQSAANTAGASGLGAGIRWRDENYGLPPATVVASLFRRHTRVEMLDSFPPVAAPRNDAGGTKAATRRFASERTRRAGGAHWFCGLVSNLDVETRELSTGNWVATNWILPDDIACLIVVNDPIPHASLFHVRKSREAQQELRLISFPEIAHDLSFRGLRSACLDVVLGIVESLCR